MSNTTQDNNVLIQERINALKIDIESHKSYKTLDRIDLLYIELLWKQFDNLKQILEDNKP